MAEANRELREFSTEELKSLTEDLNEVLVKHNAEMGVTSTINLMKSVVEDNGATTDNGKENVSTKETDTETD